MEKLEQPNGQSNLEQRSDVELLREINVLFEEDLRVRVGNHERFLSFTNRLDRHKPVQDISDAAESYMHKRVQSWEHVASKLEERKETSGRETPVEEGGEVFLRKVGVDGQGEERSHKELWRLVELAEDKIADAKLEQAIMERFLDKKKVSSAGEQRFLEKYPYVAVLMQEAEAAWENAKKLKGEAEAKEKEGRAA